MLKALNGALSFKGTIAYGHHKLKHSGNQKSLPVSITYLSQESFVQFPILMRDLVVMGRYRHTRFLQPYTAEDYRYTHDIMAKLGIQHLSHVPVPDVSGGERQLAWIAQALLQDAEIYLLDEPTQNLDLYHRLQVMQLFAALSKEKGKTVIFSTHDLELLSEINGKLINLSGHQSLINCTAEAIQEQRKILIQRPDYTS